MAFADLRHRFFALVLDFALLGVVFFLVTKVIKGVWIMSKEDHLWSWGWIITDPLCITFLIIIFVYFVLLEGFLGATAGKSLLNLRVVNLNGHRPGVAKATIRNLLRIIDGLPAFNILGVVLILASKEKARFGDRVAGTRVIKIR